jgi:23S rRNA (adenine2503-C2)-methyltransferase
MTSLRGMSRSELERLVAGLGEPRYRAQQIFHALHHHRMRRVDEIDVLPLALRSRLVEAGLGRGLEVEHRALAPDGTEKFILADVSDDGSRRQIEAVWIVGQGRRTVCLSCQVGCSLDCTFCATGTLPFAGNLEVWQMIDQVRLLEQLRDEAATNVVFMGMGEPFHNYDRVLAAADLLHDPEGSGLGARRITISTAGVIAGVERFTREERPYNLAISLNHPDPVERTAVMPINERQPLEGLLAAARRYTRDRRRKITFEYVMMAGVNMEPRHGDQLVAIARSMRCKINLIPLNTDLAGMSRPSPGDAADFRRRLQAEGIDVFDRGSPGREVGGACGMLALTRSGRGGATPVGEQV